VAGGRAPAGGKLWSLGRDSFIYIFISKNYTYGQKPGLEGVN